MDTTVLIGDILIILCCICLISMIIVTNRAMRINKMILAKLKDQVYCSEEINNHLKNVDEDIYSIKMMRSLN